MKGRKPSFAPCTPQACMEILSRRGINLDGKHVVVLGRSNIVGTPVAMLCLHQNATVTICHSRTKDLPSIIKQADLFLFSKPFGTYESISQQETNSHWAHSSWYRCDSRSDFSNSLVINVSNKAISSLSRRIRNSVDTHINNYNTLFNPFLLDLSNQ